MSDVKKNDTLTKYIVGKIASDIERNISQEIENNNSDYNKGQIMEQISKIKTLEFIKTMSSPYVNADWDAAEAIRFVGIDNCLRYLRSFCQKFNSSAFDFQEEDIQYNLRFGEINTNESVSTKAGSFSNDWFNNFGVYGVKAGFNDLTPEEQETIWQEFKDSLLKMDDTISRICNREPGFDGLPQYEGLTEEKVLKGLEQLLSQCDNLIYKMGSIVETNSNEVSSTIKR